LGDIVEIASRKKVRAPAIIVIGNVVQLYDGKSLCYQ
jgi:siroheme synthase